jgi:hypothetical protein
MNKAIYERFGFRSWVPAVGQATAPLKERKDV